MFFPDRSSATMVTATMRELASATFAGKGAAVTNMKILVMDLSYTNFKTPRFRHCGLSFVMDNFLPEFNREEETAIVSDPWSPEVVYTAQALDGDLGSTCPSEAMICDCAETRYSITEGDPNKLFYINNLTGEVYVKEASLVVSGKMYNLTLTAKSSRGQMSPSPNARMTLRIVIDDLHHHLAKVLQQNVLTWLGDDDDTLSRSKRSTENKNYNTEFNFTLVSGEAENMETGGFLKYLLEISLPETQGMDLTVEFFTKDIGNGNYTPVLALFNVEILDKPDGVSFSKGEPHIEMLLSDEIMTAYDRAIVTFGEVKNTNSEPVPMYMTFSVTQIKHPGTIFDTKYLVTAGAEYDKETYVWVGQSEVTVHNSTDEKRVEVEISGPKEIALDSAGVYVLIAHCSVRSDNFTFEVFGPEEENVVTVGNLGVKDFDVNYDPVPQSIYFYNTTKEGSDDDVVYTSAKLNLGIMTNVGNHGEPKEEGNVINVTFAIYALNNETHLGKEVSFTTKVTVGREVLHSEPFKVKLVERKKADKMIDVQNTLGDLTTVDVGVGDMAMYTLWSNLTYNGYADYVLEVDVLRYKGIPRLEACSARLWNYKDSFDVPYLNTTFIDPEIVDGRFLFKFNRIHVTGQRTPAIYNDSMIYVHLIMKVSALPVNKENTRLTPTLRVGTQGTPEHEVKVPGLEIKKKGDYQAPAMVVENGVEWPYLYVGGAVVLNITMLVPRGQGYAEVFMEASGENNPPLPAVHICRAELSDVGRNVPCLRMHQDEVNANFTKYSKTTAGFKESVSYLLSERQGQKEESKRSQSGHRALWAHSIG
ncbi:cadherin domain-containing protein [Caerostris darwini]|uniref:Cadherin domain-containing protein n=1 Tax=Caerostris darwini TaxID=1538125 RepID=A0AAV4V816_9ARAC|nr:cadherin domain-containing protein [Caerostris darwini]